MPRRLGSFTKLGLQAKTFGADPQDFVSPKLLSTARPDFRQIPQQDVAQAQITGYGLENPRTGYDAVIQAASVRSHEDPCIEATAIA